MLIQLMVDKGTINIFLENLHVVLFILGVAAFGISAAGRTPWPPFGEIDRRGRNLFLGLGLIFMVAGGVWYKYSESQKVTENQQIPISKPEANSPGNSDSGKIIEGGKKKMQPDNIISDKELKHAFNLIETTNLKDTVLIEWGDVKFENDSFIIEFNKKITLNTNAKHRIYVRKEISDRFRKDSFYCYGWESHDASFQIFNSYTKELQPFKIKSTK